MRARALTTDGRNGPPLIGPAELEQLRRLTLQHRASRRTPGAARTTGSRPSHWRGHGMELHDVRPYQPGDEIRHLDWRATARSGKPITKVFIEERARRLFLLIDRRPSMLFGTRLELKAATAARIAAILAFSALADREPVSGLVLGATTTQWFPPARSLAGVLRLLQAAAAAPGQGGLAAGAAPAPPSIGTHAPRGTTCCLISDFHEVMAGDAPLEAWLPADRSIRSRGDVVAIQVLDEAERRLPDVGPLRLATADGRHTTVVDTGDAALRRRYQADVVARLATLRRQCEQHRVHLIDIDHQRSLLTQLEGLL